MIQQPLRFNFEKFLSHESSKKLLKNKLYAFRKNQNKTTSNNKKREENISYFLNLRFLNWSPDFCTFEEGFKPQCKMLLKAVL